MTTTNLCGVASESQSISVSFAPVAQFSTAQNASGCSVFTVDFIDNSLGSPTSWNWSFPGGNPSTANVPNPTVSYATPGVYDVSLVVGNSAGSDSQTLGGFVEVLGPPSASYDFDVQGNRLELTNTTPGTTARWWISDGATFDGNQVVHILGANGTYSVTLEVTGTCGIDTREFDFTINAYPTSSFSSVNTLNSECAPQVVQFNSDSPLATNFQWDFPGGTPANSTEANPVITYNTAGVYDVSLQVSNAYGSDFSSQSSLITVDDVPTVAFTSMANGPTISFTNTSTNSTSYSWDFGDGNTSNMENPDHNYDQPGTYEVTFIASNDCGSSEIRRAVIFDFALPIVNAQFSDTLGCAPLAVQITDQSANDPIAWSWEMPGGNPSTSTEQNPIVTYDQAGVYTISAEVTNADGSSSLEFTDIIVVNDLPTPGFEITPTGEATISTTNTSTGAQSYSWDFGDGTTSTEFEPDHEYTESGDYEVTMIASNECGGIAAVQVITITITITPTSTQDLQVFGAWSLSPNPSNGEVNISFENVLTDQLNYQVTDIHGRDIMNGTLERGIQNKNLSIAES